MSILQPALQPVLRPLLADPLAPSLGDGLTAGVKALFASGEKGVMFDLSRASNLYTDSARTTLVTASGDAIGSVTDLSGNGKHASSAGTARPLWNSGGYGTFDALDDYLQTAAIDFSSTDAVTIVACVRKTGASTAMVAELSTNASTTAGTFFLTAPHTSPDQYGFRSSGSLGVVVAASGYGIPHTGVVTGAADVSSDTATIRVNGVQGATSASDQGTGNYGNFALYVGSRAGASFLFAGNLYRLLVIGRALTTTERSLAERWAAQPAGVVLA